MKLIVVCQESTEIVESGRLCLFVKTRILQTRDIDGVALTKQLQQQNNTTAATPAKQYNSCNTSKTIQQLHQQTTQLLHQQTTQLLHQQTTQLLQHQQKNITDATTAKYN